MMTIAEWLEEKGRKKSRKKEGRRGVKKSRAALP
jgi:hypothetical protein